jgi:two-component system nitrate/nitrite response regulator NarL
VRARPARVADAPGTRRAVAPIRVLAAGRQPLLREAVARAVRQRASFQLVAEISDGRAALDAIERTCPDVAVLELRLAGLDGARVLNAVMRDGLATRVLLLAEASDADEAYAAIAAGASGWLSKRADEHELCAAIATVARGHVALAPDVQTAIASEIRRRAMRREPLLDERERSVLALVAQGRSAPAIARELGMSAGSVKSSLIRLYQRLGVSDRAAAVAVAMRRGLID